MCSFCGVMQAKYQNESILFTQFVIFLQNRLQVAEGNKNHVTGLITFQAEFL